MKSIVEARETSWKHGRTENAGWVDEDGARDMRLGDHLRSYGKEGLVQELAEKGKLEGLEYLKDPVKSVPLGPKVLPSLYVKGGEIVS